MRRDQHAQVAHELCHCKAENQLLPNADLPDILQSTTITVETLGTDEGSPISLTYASPTIMTRNTSPVQTTSSTYDVTINSTFKPSNPETPSTQAAVTSPTTEANGNTASQFYDFTDNSIQATSSNNDVIKVSSTTQKELSSSVVTLSKNPSQEELTSPKNDVTTSRSPLQEDYYSPSVTNALLTTETTNGVEMLPDPTTIDYRRLIERETMEVSSKYFVPTATANGKLLRCRRSTNVV